MAHSLFGFFINFTQSSLKVKYTLGVVNGNTLVGLNRYQNSGFGIHTKSIS